MLGGWRNIGNEEFSNLYCSPYIVREIRSKMLARAGT